MHHHRRGRRVSREPSVQGHRSSTACGCGGRRHGRRRAVRRGHCRRPEHTGAYGRASLICGTRAGCCAAAESSRRKSSSCSGPGAERASSSAEHASTGRTRAPGDCRLTSNRHAADDGRGQQSESAEARSTSCCRTGAPTCSACSTATAFRRSRCLARLCTGSPDGELAHERKSTRRG